MSVETIGRAELLQMQREGWRFNHSGTRVANGWLQLALDPRGNFEPVIFADPEQEPEKWSDDAGPRAEADQLALL